MHGAASVSRRKTRGAALVRIEDAFLRSLRPGRMGDAPMGLLLDGFGRALRPVGLAFARWR